MTKSQAFYYIAGVLAVTILGYLYTSLDDTQNTNQSQPNETSTTAPNYIHATDNTSTSSTSTNQTEI